MRGHRYARQAILTAILVIKMFALNSNAFAQESSPTILIGDVEWRQLTVTTPISWDDVAQVCPAGGGECNGSINGVDYDGWNWATIREISYLFSYFRPDFHIPEENETDLWALIHRDAFNLPNDDLDLFFTLFDVNGLQGENQDLPYVGGWAADLPIDSGGFGVTGFMPMVGIFDYNNSCCTSPHGEFSTVARTSTNWDGTPTFGRALLRGAWLYRIVETDPCGVSSILDECCPDEGTHGQYVSCIAKALSDLKKQGAITERERGALQRAAARKKK